MSDDSDRYDLPEDSGMDDNEFTDEDVPFRLPKAENAGSFRKGLGKDETEDLILQPDAFDGEEDDEEDIAALHASDPPLAGGPPEDNTMVQRAGHKKESEIDTDELEMTVPHDRSGFDVTEDLDVPFHLPKSDPTDEDEDVPIGSKFVTMPNRPARDDKTLPGTGGLDPNPDVASAGQTVPHMRVPAPQEPAPSQQTVPGNYQRFQRPAQAPVYGTPQQRDIPQAPAMQPGPARPRPLPSQRRRRRLNPGCMILLVMMLTFCGGLTFITMVAGAFAYVRVGDLLSDRLAVIDTYKALQSNTILDRNGDELFTVFSEEGMRININIEELPPYVIDATIAIEDDSFYSHVGIDVAATFVAFLEYVGASPEENTPGGSTITQQLVRNVLFDPEYRAERSARRKAEEIMLAIALEARRSKDDIMELYLNQIYYGNLAYGIEAASQTIFEKSARDLTLGEAALLAGLPNIPAFLDPLSDDPEVQTAVEQRRRLVLAQMLNDRSITQQQYDAAIAERMRFGDGNINLSAPHFTVHALEELDGLLAELGYTEEQIEQGGLNVLTTVDLGINNMAQETARARIAELTQNNASNAAVVVLNPATGEILGMVGSIDYYNEAIDGNVNVTTRPRQPGSTAKAFTYAAALESGMSTGDVIWDTPTSIGIPGQAPYVPRNYDGGFHGPMRMRTALANSYNIPAVQTLRLIGVDVLLNFMSRFGVESLGTDASRYGLSLTLGGGEITLLELTQGYSVFANEGQLVRTTSILCIWDNDNTIIYEYNNSCPSDKRRSPDSVTRGIQREQVLDPRIAFIISDILGDNVARSTEMGSGSALYTPNISSSVKTGTTNDVKDNWTVGYTRNVAIGVWVGNNNGDSMTGGISGLRSAAPIWNRVLTTIYETPLYLNEFASGGQLRPDQRVAPNGMSFVRICDVRRLADPATSCPATATEWVLDSPAGQYDGNGNIIYPPGGFSQQERAQTGSFVQEVEPGVYRTAVYRLDPGVASAIQFNLGPEDRQPPPPLYCRVPVDMIATTPNVQEQLFIAPPRFQSDAAAAEEWARQNNLAFLPTIDCIPELLVGGGPGSNILTAYIIAPSPGQTLPAYTELAIIGTAQFTPQQATYFKVDLIGGDITDWRTIGPIHTESVVNGQLDVLPALPPGQYRLRLEIIGLDGNVAQPGFEVPFIVQ